LRLETRRLVEGVIDQLPDALRTVFVLCEIEELPVEVIAAALEISPDLVRARHLRATCLVRESFARAIEDAMEDVFAFAGARCDRLVAGVLARLEELPAAGA
jgi:RNA polymerase sigma-70 factor (ECF subfamily)